jgi:hypothetical protein
VCLGLNSLSSYLPYQLFVKLLHSPSEVSASAKADLSYFVDVFDLQMPVRLYVRICLKMDLCCLSIMYQWRSRIFLQ